MYVVLQNSDQEELARFKTEKEAEKYITKVIRDYEDAGVLLFEEDFVIEERT